jgi:thioredoxin-dependent peroxiredoxin
MTKELETQKIKAGDKVESFTVKIQNGKVFSSDELLQDYNYILLVFYPGDDTPGCTKQLCGIRDVYEDYKKLGVKVLGVNHASDESHSKFINKYKYQFDIVVDSKKELVSQFGAKGMFFKHPVVKRGVFLIDKNHTVVYKIWGQQDNTKIISLINSL